MTCTDDRRKAVPNSSREFHVYRHAKKPLSIGRSLSCSHEKFGGEQGDFMVEKGDTDTRDDCNK